MYIYLGARGPSECLKLRYRCVLNTIFPLSLSLLKLIVFSPRCQQSYDMANAALSECQKLRTGHCAEHLSAEVTFAEVTFAQVC